MHGWVFAVHQKLSWHCELGGSHGKASVYNVRNLGLIPGLGRFLGEGNGNPLQYSCLENPMERGAWCRLLSMGSQRVGHDWVTSLFLSVQFSRSVVSYSLRPYELQHARPPCPSPTPRDYQFSSVENKKLKKKLPSKLPVNRLCCFIPFPVSIKTYAHTFNIQEMHIILTYQLYSVMTFCSICM